MLKKKKRKTKIFEGRDNIAFDAVLHSIRNGSLSLGISFDFHQLCWDIRVDYSV